MSSIVLRCDVGDLDVSTGLLRMPLRGNWAATLDIGAPELPTEGTSVELRFTRTDGTVDVFSGVIRRARRVPDTETLDVTIVGGAGRLFDPPIHALHHAGATAPVPAGAVLSAIVQAAGEQLAQGAEAELDGAPLAQWTRLAGEAQAALDVLTYTLSFGWRVLADGTIWAGAETWPAVDASADYYSGDPRDGSLFYAPDGAPYRPGTTIDGVRAVEVCYALQGPPKGVRCEVRGALAGDTAFAPDLSLYRGSYPGSVRAQLVGAGGPLDVTCDDERVKDVFSVPLRIALPFGKVEVDEDTRVCVRFDGGDPRGAYACDIDQDATADKSVARVGDVVAGGSLAWVSGGEPGAIVVTYTDAIGQVSAVTLAAPGLTVVPVPPGDGVMLIREGIRTGHPRVMLTSEGQ